MKPTIPELLEKLVTHGDERQIVDHLIQEGVTGFRGESESCVISRYLIERSGVQTLSTGLSTGGRWPGRVIWDAQGGGPDRVDLPEVLNSLGHNFDGGMYPELEREL